MKGNQNKYKQNSGHPDLSKRNSMGNEITMIPSSQKISQNTNTIQESSPLNKIKEEFSSNEGSQHDIDQAFKNLDDKSQDIIFTSKDIKIEHKNNLQDTESVHIGSQKQLKDSTKEIHEMAIENSSMSIKGSKNTPQRAKENENAVLFDINEWD